MKVRMLADVSGTRDGQDWPKRGKIADLPDDEAASLCASGIARPLNDEDGDVEAAVPDDADVEKRSGDVTATAGVAQGTGTAVSPGGDGSTGMTTGNAPTKAPAKKTAASKPTAN